MQRRKFNIPLLIGGATTSKAHTALKIENNYQLGPVIHVIDASRSVGVVQNLVNKKKKDLFIKEIKKEYIGVRKRLREKKPVNLMSIQEANKNKLKINWENYEPTLPSFYGPKTYTNIPIGILKSYIDWTPFFKSWGLSGKFPKILENKIVGNAAQKLFEEANEMLEHLEMNKIIQTKAVVGFWQCDQTEENNIVVYKNNKFQTEVQNIDF